MYACMHIHTHTLVLHATKMCVCAPDKRQAEYEGVVLTGWRLKKYFSQRKLIGLRHGSSK